MIVKYIKYGYTLLLLSFVFSGFAQSPSLQKLVNKNSIDSTEDYAIRLVKAGGNQATVQFKTAAVKESVVKEWLAKQLKFRKNIDELRIKSPSEKTIQNLSVQKLQQYYKGVKVVHGITTVTAKNGNAAFMQSEFYAIPDNFSTTATISETQARDAAFQYLKNNKYQPAAALPPPAELVIAGNRQPDEKPALVYLLLIDAVSPFASFKVYVDASTGKVLFSENLTCTANAAGTANTRYSGVQAITTNKINNYTYELKLTTDYGVQIETLNFKQRDAANPANIALASPFTDSDNKWENLNNVNFDNAALDAHFNMKLVSDFWFETFGRKSYDGKSSPLVSYVHVTNSGIEPGFMANAYFNKTGAMFYGDGKKQDDASKQKPLTTLDITGHEFAHGVTRTTCELVYAWESGALNESLSDIWGASTELYANSKVPGMVPKNPWFMGDEVDGFTGARNFADPSNASNPAATRHQPDTYQAAPYWIEASYGGCPFPEFKPNDYCGVHTNSGVMNKWFYLLVNGGSGINAKGIAYAVNAIGLNAAQKIVYLSQLNLTPNAGFATMAAVSQGVSALLYEPGSFEAEAVKNAWIAVGVTTKSIIFNQENTPGVFSTSDFTSIAIGAKNYVWAGTSLNGLYRYNGTIWEKAPVVLNRDINQITRDKNGGIWIAQSGHEGNKATAGGVNYFKDETFESHQFFGSSIQNNNLPSRFTRGIFVDTSFTGATPRVWTATAPDFNASLDANGDVIFEYNGGGIGLGFNVSPPNFARITKGLNKIAGTSLYGVKVIGGDDKEVWVYDDVNLNAPQIMRYHATTADSIGNISLNGGAVPKNTVTAIHFDNQYNKWIGFENGGLAVLDFNNQWHVIKLETIVPELYEGVAYPEDARVNANSITSDSKGNVYIGTDNGLIMYTGFNELEKPGAYKLFTTAHGLPSNNVKSIVISYSDNMIRPFIATDNGIMFMEALCRNCGKTPATLPTAFASSIIDGNWSNPAVWNTNTVPDQNTEVIIKNKVDIDTQAACRSLKLVLPGAVKIKTGVTLTIVEPEDSTVETQGKKVNKTN